MQQQASSPSSVESTWTSHDHRLFLAALVAVPEDTTERWEKIAMAIPGKTPEEVIAHHQALHYASLTDDQHAVVAVGDQSVMGKGRKMGTSWTEEEHTRFVEGLEKYGREVSRNNKDQEKVKNRRSSIHDITTVADTTTTVAPAQPPSPPSAAATNVSPANFHGGQEIGAETGFGSFNYEALHYASLTDDQVIPAHPVVAGEDQSVVGSSSESRSKRMGKGRKRGTRWTVEEHNKFLEGLEKYGKGDWRSISRNLLPSKTPAQLARHAQQYFIRHKPNKTDQEKTKKRRSSIHDITTPTTVADGTTTVAPTQPPSPPAAAATNVSPVGPSLKTFKFF